MVCESSPHQDSVSGPFQVPTFSCPIMSSGVGSSRRQGGKALIFHSPVAHLIHLFIHSFIHSFVHSFINSIDILNASRMRSWPYVCSGQRQTSPMPALGEGNTGSKNISLTELEGMWYVGTPDMPDPQNVHNFA